MKICEECAIYVDDGCDRCTACEGAVIDFASLVDGRYAIRRELGRGGMGVVYLARDVGLRRDVAVKMIAPKYARDPAVVARFRREAAVLATIRSEHVVQVYACGGSSQPFFVMEYVQGKPLHRILSAHARAEERVPLRRALTVVRQIAGALDAIHAAGALHRDVKPDNVVIEDRTGRPVLIDFGLVGHLDESGITRHIGYGTPEYMAPEQGPFAEAHAAQGTVACDVYSLACMAFELFTGKPPFYGEDANAIFCSHAHREPPKPSSLRPELAPLDAAMARALAKRPGDRFPSAGELARALDVAAASEPLRAPAVSAHPPALGEPLRVLVVDDDESWRRYADRAIRFAFEGTPVAIETAADGEQAMAAMLSRPPHVMLLDYSMPGLNGVETLARVRELPGGFGVRVLVVSANVGEVERRRFAVLGVTDFAEKPVGLRVLARTVRDLAAARAQAPAA